MSALFRSLAVLGFAMVVATGAKATEPVDQAGETIKVHIDQAKLLKLPEGVSTLVIGNPLIADVAVQSGGTMVVTGKGYGNTNLIALDRSGAVILDHQIQVQGPMGKVVVVYRGIERESYSCAPVCERRITLGDTQNYFTQTMTQSGTLNTLAHGGAQQQPK